MSCLILVFWALAGSHASWAQQKTTFRRFPGGNELSGTAQLDLETGTIIRGPAVQTRAGSSVSTFPNIDLGGFVGADTGSCACEWYDAGIKSGGQSSYVSGFTFAYCSAAIDPLSGGPGGSAELFFNAGYSLGGNGVGQPPNGTEVARILVTGLPANTACSSFFGGFRCFFMTVRLAATFCLPDGAIGYGWKFVDLGTPGNLAKTFPFMSCVQSCSSSGPDGLGMVNLLDQYCPPGVLLSTFTFTSCCILNPYFMTISMDIRELSSTGALPSASFVTGNLATLTDHAGTLGCGPALGDPSEPYGVSLDCSAATTAGVYRLDVRSGLAAAGVPTGFGLLAAVGPLLQKFTGAHVQDTVSTPTLTVPKDVTFACLSYTNQGWCKSSPQGILSNALRETIGVP